MLSFTLWIGVIQPPFPTVKNKFSLDCVFSQFKVMQVCILKTIPSIAEELGQLGQPQFEVDNPPC